MFSDPYKHTEDCASFVLIRAATPHLSTSTIPYTGDKANCYVQTYAQNGLKGWLRP